MVKKVHDSPAINQSPHTDTPAIALPPAPPVRLTLAPVLTGVGLATMRDIRFSSRDRFAADGTKIPGNGFAPAFLTLGRAVYVDVPVFIEIWRAKQSKGVARG